MTIIGTYPPYQNPDLPPGIVVPYAGFAAPVGWLLCDGQAVSRALYSSLFAVIGGQYGGGDGVNTFNVPDLRGRAVYGIGDGTPGVNYHGANEGQPWVHLRGPHHGHSHTLNDPGHTHTYHYPQAVDWQYTNWLNAGPFWSATSETSLAYTGISISVGAQGYSIQNAPSHLALYYIIRV